MFEQSSFAKLMIVGRDAAAVLNRIATANVDVAVGRCVYTQFLNSAGGIEADLTVTRLAGGSISWWSPRPSRKPTSRPGSGTRSPRDAFCTVIDVSDAYAMLNLQGPASRALLQSLSSDDFSASRAFRLRTCREVRIGYQTALALRLTYVGELGWELYIPTSFAQPVYDALIEAGKAHGLRHCGYHTLNSLRIEKAYRDWSHDIGPADTPLEAGLAFTCDWQQARRLHRPRGPRCNSARLERRSGAWCSSCSKIREPLLYHNEPIYRDGERVGFVTSAMYGHTLGAAVGLGYVAHEDGCTDDYIRAGRYEIELASARVGAKASLAPALRPEEPPRARLKPDAEFDVVIAGGGAVGSACAYFLTRDAAISAARFWWSSRTRATGLAASTRSASSIRLQFSSPINITLSVFGMEFLRDAPRRLAQAGASADVGLIESSYLYLATLQGRAALEQRVVDPTVVGRGATLHDRSALGVSISVAQHAKTSPPVAIQTAGKAGSMVTPCSRRCARKTNPAGFRICATARSDSSETPADGSSAVKLESQGRSDAVTRSMPRARLRAHWQRPPASSFRYSRANARCSYLPAPLRFRVVRS